MHHVYVVNKNAGPYMVLEYVASRTEHEHDQHVIYVFTHAHRSFLSIFCNSNSNSNTNTIEERKNQVQKETRRPWEREKKFKHSL